MARVVQGVSRAIWLMGEDSFYKSGGNSSQAHVPSSKGRVCGVFHAPGIHFQ